MVWGMQFADFKVRGQMLGNISHREHLIWPDGGEYKLKKLMWPEDGECNSGELRTTRVAKHWEV
jgi:hypothetical protein